MGVNKNRKSAEERNLTAKETAFVRAHVVDGLGVVSAYKAVYSINPDDHERHIKIKAEDVFNRPAVQREIKALRESIREEAVNEAIWTRDDSLKMLSEIAKISKAAMCEKVNVDGKDVEVYDSKAASAAVKALAEINKMLGLNQPEEHDITIRLGNDLDEYAR